MINKHDKIEFNDLEQLQSNAVLESKTIEYKKLLPTNSDADRKEFLADISSFANASGGDVIFGISEGLLWTQGYAGFPLLAGQGYVEWTGLSKDCYGHKAMLGSRLWRDKTMSGAVSWTMSIKTATLWSFSIANDI